ncbi:circadian clock protein KaiA [Desertifilum sp. FACHB-1129]|uniref:Circadian clock oscillator protein KaiA n=2 Tax=Desertifilum tharense IPPAS B-1220 TaxID=1781255 RepID=A0A1E5QI71_9CYAN|nr:MULTISPECIES: circadian clock protein KaiA [Desertifilum]MDA0212050.1 circadian clock protein KaiA [Cyanobacteria bacterium FC1]MBD2314413.1 circadian clock protein KaiA [Desertifilum sp. FACHB-1129]MBD2324892.1 circadian clock protein KaiA [Desertifilum sp. FACHB-866]MBD2334985.1 circadian clock protein KaiA [Desertifilum sp. FACHB-868]OEJ74318.1 circadian clock protein KaiA [Desertifilum tharense IPPAS B-1220]
MRSSLSICTLIPSEALAQSLQQSLTGDRYSLALLRTEPDFWQFLEKEKQHIDCLIVEKRSNMPAFLERLRTSAALLPMVILAPNSDVYARSDSAAPSQDYELRSTLEVNESDTASNKMNSSIVELSQDKLDRISLVIEQAITAFLKLSTAKELIAQPASHSPIEELTTENSLKMQQRRLAEKLKERLGYLGVYYKRDPKNFLRHLPADQKQELLKSLKQDYREIVLSYFADTGNLNQKIDEFVNTAFFTDISVSQIVEIHMELMDDFSKQLKLEGRSEEILLDYRLTLIDIIAHLCEMYRRSIPRES